MDKGALAEILFSDYINFREHTVNWKRVKECKRYMRPMKLTDERKRIFEIFIDWCDKRGLPPRQWIYTLFAIRRWIFAPQLELKFLCSEKHIPKFESFSDYRFYQRYLDDQSEKTKWTNEKLFDPNIELTRSVEETKRSIVLIGGPQACMDVMTTETFGYHPKSQICTVCDGRFNCAEKLQALAGFDILSLRRGEIKKEDILL